jgi:hypothetical protein
MCLQIVNQNGVGKASPDAGIKLELQISGRVIHVFLTIDAGKVSVERIDRTPKK